jgi:thioredoxin reductase
MTYDALVVGGSIAGVSAALQLARARRSVCVIDAASPRNRFAATSQGVFGHDGTPPRELIGRARDQLSRYPTATLVEGTVVTAAGRDGGFGLTLASGASFEAKVLVLAFGVSDTLPDLPGLAERWGVSVLHCGYCHGYEHDGPLGVLNVAPPSARQAALIRDWGPTTFFLNGRDDLDTAARDLLARRGVSIEPAPIAVLVGDAPNLAGVRLADGRTVEIEALFVRPRVRLNSDLAEQLGCAIDEGPVGPYIRVDGSQQTTVARVFAAGDIARVGHDATLASAGGVMAGTSAHQALVFDAP